MKTAHLLLFQTLLFLSLSICLGHRPSRYESKKSYLRQAIKRGDLEAFTTNSSSENTIVIQQKHERLLQRGVSGLYLFGIMIVIR